MTDVQLGVLGPCVARVDGAPVTLSAARLRSLLGVLALWRGQTVPSERIIDVLWVGSPSPGASSTLQGYVALTRRALEPQRRPREAATVLVHEAGGYRLDLAPEQIDAGRFEAAVLRSQSFLRGFADPMRPMIVREGAEGEAVQADLDLALALWRGDAYTDLGDFSPAATERRRLDALRVDARTARVVIDLALGRTAAAVVTLEELVSAHPLREQLWGLWAVALVRSDRQAHALDVLGRLRSTLSEELGIDPSPAIATLQEDILRQAPSVLGTGEAVAPTERPARPAEPPRGAAPRRDQAGARHLPLVGRERELAVLKEAVHAAAGGHVQLCVLAGEAGIGKTRLTAELTQWAQQAGLATVATIRGVEDDGAPPLWGLTKTFSDLSARTGVPLPDLARAEPSTRDEEAAAAGRFALCDALSDFVHAVAERTPLLLVVEDTHWCDPTTLRVLRHLVEHTTDASFMLLVSRRPDEGATGSADLDASLTRCGARWLPLSGLTTDDVAALADLLLDAPLPVADVASLRKRAGGNPLYVAELLRAAAAGDSHLPASLAGLIRRRLDLLPAETSQALQVAAVSGPEFTPGVVSGALEVAATDELIEVLEPARAAGILRERADGTWLFTHALVRDAILEAIRPAELRTWHARLAATLESATHDAQARGEVARHWRAAGPQHAAQAWRATASAAARAESVFAFQEAAGLLAEALRSQRLDLESSDLERFELLERRAGACRLASDWSSAAVAVIEAIAVAERIDEPALAARVATSLPVGSIWHVQRYGTVAGDLVHALRRSLELVDPADAALRCRILLAIASSSFYIATVRELDDLVQEALAIAEEVRDDELRCLALQQAYTARWRPATAQWRLGVATEALELARRTGNLRFEAICGAQLAISLVETGKVEEAHAVLSRAVDLAESLGFATVTMTLELLRLPMSLLAGRDDDAQRSLHRVLALQERVTDSNLPAAIAASQLLILMWQGRVAEFVAAATQAPPQSEAPIELFAVMALLRLGQDDAAARLYASMPAAQPDDTYMGMIVAATSAEIALRLGMPALADRMSTWLGPYSGGVASAGSIAVLGPVDAFLALAAAGSGRLAEATSYADRALAQCERWGMPRASSWLAELRTDHGF